MRLALYGRGLGIMELGAGKAVLNFMVRNSWVGGCLLEDVIKVTLLSGEVFSELLTSFDTINEFGCWGSVVFFLEGSDFRWDEWFGEVNKKVAKGLRDG